MINGHGDDAYRYTAIRANFSSNVYHRVNHDGLNRYLSGYLSCIRSYPEPEPMHWLPNWPSCMVSVRRKSV